MFKKITRILLLFLFIYQGISAGFSIGKGTLLGLLYPTALSFAIGAYAWKQLGTQQVENEGKIQDFNKERDLQKVAALISASSVQMYGSAKTVKQSVEKIENAVEQGYILKVLYEKSTLIACVAYSPCAHKQSGDIVLFCVDAAYRCKGLGKKLLCSVLDEYWKVGALKVLVSVHKNNKNAHAFYSKYGAQLFQKGAEYYHFCFESPFSKAVLLPV
jgi:ribosomal protein S18 acetylase RimI-like enzyme